MKKLVLFSVAVVASGLGFAQDVGRVISSTPVTQQVAVPRQVCTTEQVAVQQPKSGAGAAIGAIAGGAMGNAIGHGAGRAAATMIGIVGGAVVGDSMEGSPSPQIQDIQYCGVQTFYENRPVAYNVVYEFGGKQYAVQMPNDPGPSIGLQVSPVGTTPQVPVPTASAVVPQPAYVQQAPYAYVQQPAYAVAPVAVYPGYYPRPYYPPVGISLGFGYWGGYRGHHW
jgi:uncharacterized protein YcfJ